MGKAYSYDLSTGQKMENGRTNSAKTLVQQRFQPF